VLPSLLPKAIAWAETQEAQALHEGRRLTDLEIALARCVGVKRPDLVRVVAAFQQLPMPLDPDLRAAALQTGLLGPGMVGLTLGHGIFVVTGHETPRLISHECRHVHQYEAAGSIAAFLPEYLEQVARVGYQNAAFEIDARTWERDGA
jgi:hypothetical protein